MGYICVCCMFLYKRECATQTAHSVVAEILIRNEMVCNDARKNAQIGVMYK